MEELALAGLAQGFRLESLDEGLVALGTPHSGGANAHLTAQPLAEGLPGWSFTGDEEAALFPAALPAILNELVMAQASTYGLWWTNGSDRVAPTLRSFTALPAAEDFAAFLSADADPAESNLAEFGL